MDDLEEFSKALEAMQQDIDEEPIIIYEEYDIEQMSYEHQLRQWDQQQGDKS